MILNRKHALIRQRNPTIGAIKQRDMGLYDTFWQAVRVQSKAMIHGDNFHFARSQIFNRMIGTVMTLWHFHCLPAKSKAQQLMTQTYPKNRYARGDKSLDCGHSINACSSRVARPIRQQYAVGLMGEDFIRTTIGGHDSHMGID